MRKSAMAAIAVAVMSLALLLGGCSNAKNDGKAEAVKGALQTSYLLEKEKVTLSNGLFEKPAAPGSAAMNRTQVWEQPVAGDLNADGKADAAVCLINSPGGSGTFYYIAAAVYDGNAKNYKGTNAVLLGDRIRISEIRIEKQIITVVYNDRQPGEPMTAPPIVSIAKKFRLDNGLLTEVAGPG